MNRTTLIRMQAACGRVSNRADGAPASFIEACVEVADEMVAEVIAAMPSTEALTFDEVSVINEQRCRRWHHGFPDGRDAWTGADWSNAMCGEAGEAANVVKKLRRIETGTPGSQDPDRQRLVEMLGDELADTYLYLGLLAAFYGVDLPASIVRKFNAISEREGFPERLRASDGSVAA